MKKRLDSQHCIFNPRLQLKVDGELFCCSSVDDVDSESDPPPTELFELVEVAGGGGGGGVSGVGVVGVG